MITNGLLPRSNPTVNLIRNSSIQTLLEAQMEHCKPCLIIHPEAITIFIFIIHHRPQSHHPEILQVLENG